MTHFPLSWGKRNFLCISVDGTNRGGRMGTADKDLGVGENEEGVWRGEEEEYHFFFVPM